MNLPETSLYERPDGKTSLSITYDGITHHLGEHSNEAAAWFAKRGLDKMLKKAAENVQRETRQDEISTAAKAVRDMYTKPIDETEAA